MNFVQLVESLRTECGVSGSPLMSVQNVSGELLRLRNWTIAAWKELQTSRRDWQFMRGTFTFNTVANKQAYTVAETAVARLKNWKRDSFWIYDQALGISNQQVLGEMGWDWFREMYIKGPQNAQRPMAVALMPDKSLMFGPLPDKVYVVTGEYWKTVQSLALDVDVPEMPEEFHMVIVYEAMKKYAGYESANEVMARSKNEGGPLLNALEMDQLPQVTTAGGFDGYDD